MEEYDVVVVGGGPGGLTAGMMASLRGLKVLVLDGGAFGGLLVSLYPKKLILNYPGFAEGIAARELGEAWVRQAQGYGVVMKRERVVEITPELLVRTTEGEYLGRATVIATGNRPRELGIPGEMDFNYQDRGVHYYVTEPQAFQGKRALVVGGGDTALDAALDLLGVASEVYIAHRRESFRALEASIEKAKAGGAKFLLETELEAILGGEGVERALLKGKEGRFELHVDAVVLAVGQVPNTEIYQKLGLETDQEGRIVTDREQRTSVKGVFAVGDVVTGTGALELILVAASQGAVAAHHIYMDLSQPYWG
ncbi:MAG: NAD(P)/FAD-dependent oxidoreductase [Candidatus Hydrothermarchaeota archaeon]